MRNQKNWPVYGFLVAVFCLAVALVVAANVPTTSANPSVHSDAIPPTILPPTTTKLLIPTSPAVLPIVTPMSGSPRAWGIKGITPKTTAVTMGDEAANFTEDDVRQFVSQHIHESLYNATSSSVSVDKVECMTAQKLHILEQNTIGSYTDGGEPSGLVECIAFLNGTFEAKGIPGSNSTVSPSQHRYFQYGYIIFDANTGNVVGNGSYK